MGAMPTAPIDRLRSDLTDAGFTVQQLDGLWPDAAADALRRGHPSSARRALGRLERSPRTTLAALFLLGDPVPAADAAAALPALGIDGAVELGLLRVADGSAAAALDLQPYAFRDRHGEGHWWLLSDLGERMRGGEPLPEDHVLGIGGATLTLSGLIPPARPDGGRFAAALDLGTGCGIQALHAARHADRVVATDISHRALRLAELNARLNGVVTIEFRHGDLLDPVAGERFDLVVSNPPFVITPRVDGVPAYEYRDGGRVGDALVEEVVRGIAGVLAPGGVAQLLGNWEHRWGADGLDRAAGWAREAGLGHWIVERERQDPALYAETWIRDGGTRPGTPAFASLLDAWLDDFEARGVLGVGFGYMLLTADPGLARSERLTGALGDTPAGLGEHLHARLAARAAIVGLDDAALLRIRFARAVDVTEERHYWPGEPDPTVLLLRQGGGFARTIEAGTGLAALVGASDGELALGQLTAAIAALLEADPAALAAELAEQVRELVTAGLLDPLVEIAAGEPA
ncbi:methyltransferase [Arenivirga flava]|uniref:Methyltransferase n=2 Tax=Arenivirga flava TaxID=1930060 RepID=A0AA37X815_9MICO|nr:methyltransferase [Arenivirga flava]